MTEESISLKEHIERILGEMDKRYEQRFAASQKASSDALAATEKAIDKQDAASEKRFASVNEFRATLSDQAAQLLPRAEAQVEFKALRDRLDAITLRQERSEGKSTGLSAGWGYLVGLIGFLAAVAGLASRFMS
jgi:hypothetical protein